MTTGTTPLRRLFLGGALWATTGRAVTILVSLGVNMILSRALAPDQLGTWFLVWSTATLAVALGTMGVDQVTIRWIAEARAAADPRRASKVAGAGFRLAVGGATSVSAAMALAAPVLFGRLFHVPAAVPVAGLIAAWVATNVLLRQLAESFRGYQSILLATLFNGLGKSGILPNLGLLVVAAIALVSERDSLALLYGLAAVANLALVVIAFVALRRLQASELSDAETAHVGDAPLAPARVTTRLFTTSLPVFATVAVAAVRVQTDIWVLGVIAGAQDVAVYGAVLRLVLLVVTPLQVVNAILPPIIAELHAQQKLASLQTLIRTVTTLASLVSALVVALFGVFGGSLLTVVYGPFYSRGELLLLILALGHLANVAAGSCDFVLLMTGHERPFFLGTLLGASVLLILSVVLGSVFGAVGVALAAAAGLVAQNVFWISQVHRTLGIYTHVTIAQHDLRIGLRLLSARTAGTRDSVP